MVATRDQRASWSDLFGPTYLRRTLVVWVIWFAAYFMNYGLVIWLPTIFRTVFKLPLDVSLRYGLITQAAGLLGTLDLRDDHRLRRPQALFRHLVRGRGASASACWRCTPHPPPSRC